MQQQQQQQQQQLMVAPPSYRLQSSARVEVTACGLLHGEGHAPRLVTPMLPPRDAQRQRARLIPPLSRHAIGEGKGRVGKQKW